MTLESLRKADTILVVGGTFDPPHVAHLVQPVRVAQIIGADALAYIPAGRQPLKDATAQSAPIDRLAMVRLMAGLCPQASVLTLEIDRLTDGRPSYMVDTLRLLREQLTDTQGSCPVLRLLIGSDQAAAFDRWREFQKVIELAQPVVMPRPPWSAEVMIEHIRTRQSQGEAALWRDRIVDLPVLDVSSTEIRHRVRQGQSIAGMVAPAVEDYIRQHGLYRL
jgi:nicotinate-nucleotide adenylyltransferase